MKTFIASILVAFSCIALACGSEDQLQSNNQPEPPTASPEPTPPQPPTSETDIDPTANVGDIVPDLGIDAGPESDSAPVEPTDPVEPPAPPTSATTGGVQIDLVSSEGNTFCYQVTELDGSKDLSHWEIATNCTILSGTESILVTTSDGDGGTVEVNVIQSFEPGTDPKSLVTGAKWNVSDLFSTGTFCITVEGPSSVGSDVVQVASKSGLPISFGSILGPVCQ